MTAMAGLIGWQYSKALPPPAPKLEMGIGFLPLDRQIAAKLPSILLRKTNCNQFVWLPAIQSSPFEYFSRPGENEIPVIR
jgi:hypothetical protein